MKPCIALLLATVLALSLLLPAAAAESVSFTSEQADCVNHNAAILNGEGDANIFGTMYYPADFDSSKTYPVLISSHGFGNSSVLLGYSSVPWVSELTGLGCLVYGFDFCGGSPKEAASAPGATENGQICPS